MKNSIKVKQPPSRNNIEEKQENILVEYGDSDFLDGFDPEFGNTLDMKVTNQSRAPMFRPTPGKDHINQSTVSFKQNDRSLRGSTSVKAKRYDATLKNHPAPLAAKKAWNYSSFI